MKVKVIGQSSQLHEEKCSFFSYSCTLRGDIYILNRQQTRILAARDRVKVHTQSGEEKLQNVVTWRDDKYLCVR